MAKIKTQKTPPAGCKKNDNGGIEINQIIIDLICERIAGGMDFTRICEMPDMPSRTAVFYATNKNPDWKAQIDAVKPLQAERHVRAGFDVLQKAVDGEVDASAADKLAGMHRWAAQRIDPKNWGDKLSQDINGMMQVTQMPQVELDDGKPMVFNIGQPVDKRQKNS